VQFWIYFFVFSSDSLLSVDCTMAARATRSASRAASSRDDVSRCLLLALSHDELGVIFDGLADPLQPTVAVALSSTCLGLRTPLRAALEVLKVRHERTAALCRKLDKSCAQVRGAAWLYWSGHLVAADMATLGMILRTNGLPGLQQLLLGNKGLGDAGVQALCEGLGRGAAPSLRLLGLNHNKFGPTSAEALAAALRRGAFPKLEDMRIHRNPIGNQGVAALAAPLRKLPALTSLYIDLCEIGDEGVASLVANLGKDDFKALQHLLLYNNKITDAGVAKLLAALEAGGLPKLVNKPYLLKDNPASAVAVEAVHQALVKRGAPVG